MDIKLYNIVAIVNEGNSDRVMEIAKDCGARGGTIISANGSVTSDAAQQLYGLGIHPEKEIVLILVNESLVTKILENLYDKLGRSTEAMGIFFSLPVSHASDNLLNQYKKKKAPAKKEEKTENEDK
ncbi:MAG: hypothetical protein J5936_00235 [Acholeplasmatales bacterium]|nr:hypothetical protein [Acholeplasmatales bacterium]MBQ6782808.1 hypothetical protein [Acholeplasmatales bacterium]